MSTMVPPELVGPIFDPRSFGDRGYVEALLTRLRKEYPLGKAEVPGYDPHWIVTKMADLREITRQDDIFHSGDRSKVLISRAVEALISQMTGGELNVYRTLSAMDPPEHKKYRAVTSSHFSGDSIKKLMPKIEAIAGSYADKLAAAGPACDFAKVISFQYPLEVVLDILGVPRQDHARILELTQWLFNYADPDLKRPGSDPSDPEEAAKTFTLVFDEFEKLFLPMVDDRRRCPRDDVATLIANGTVDNLPLERRALISYFSIFATAGHDSTAATTATGMWMLAERPALLAELRANPDLVPRFVEETIRWATPVQQFVRSATQDYELRGQTIKKDDLIYLSYLSANRDEEVFANPFEFDIHRSSNRHIAFGFGGHTCLGIHLARMEMQALWNAILPRLESVELTAPPKLSLAELVCGPKSVPIRFRMK
jgi:cytochrome P450